VLYNRLTGDKLIIISSAESTGGEFLEMEAIYPSAGSFAPEHFHPSQDELFTVLSGKLMTRIDGVIREYQAGESFVVPSGTPHAMYNAGTENVHFRWRISPALRSEEFFRTVYRLASTHQGKPGLVDTLFLLSEFRYEFIITKIPLFLQRFLFRFGLPLLRKPR
jgi:quercetin dioxygenase-like cupin family protein